MKINILGNTVKTNHCSIKNPFGNIWKRIKMFKLSDEDSFCLTLTCSHLFFLFVSWLILVLMIGNKAISRFYNAQDIALSTLLYQSTWEQAKLSEALQNYCPTPILVKCHRQLHFNATAAGSVRVNDRPKYSALSAECAWRWWWRWVSMAGH